MFHSMLTWRELDQACFLHFQCHLSPPPPLPFFWLTLSLRSSYFHLFSLPTRHPHMCTYIISPMKTGKMNKKLLAFVDWLVSEPSQRCISLGHMSFAFGGLYVKWGNQPFEFQENSFFLFFYFNFFLVGEPHYFWISCSQRCVGLKMLSIITTLLQSLGLKGMGVCWAVFFV